MALNEVVAILGFSLDPNDRAFAAILKAKTTILTSVLNPRNPPRRQEPRQLIQQSIFEIGEGNSWLNLRATLFKRAEPPRLSTRLLQQKAGVSS
jgi:hypothetical protein